MALKIRNCCKVNGRTIEKVLERLIKEFLYLRMERLELSKQKLLGPKSSASTNFATSANFKLICLFNIQDLIERSIVSNDLINLVFS